MTIRVNEENGGETLVVRVSGALSKKDYGVLVSESERLAMQHGKLRLLFDMTDFEGWDTCVLWMDTEFAARRFSDVSRLAMVGEKQWQNGMTGFCKPFTRATIRYFDGDDAYMVRQWLDRR